MRGGELLPREVTLEEVPALVERVCAALSVPFCPGALSSEREEEALQRAGFAGSVTRTRWCLGGVELCVVREVGDNGARHEMAWEAHFFVEVSLTGLPGESALWLGETTWGASAARRFQVRGGRAREVRRALLEALGP